MLGHYFAEELLTASGSLQRAWPLTPLLIYR